MNMKKSPNLLCHFQVNLPALTLSECSSSSGDPAPPNLEPFLRAASLIEKSVSQAAAPSWLLKSCTSSLAITQVFILRERRMVGWLLGELCVTKVVSSSSVLDIVSKLPVGSGTSAKSVMKSLGFGSEELEQAATCLVRHRHFARWRPLH